jgi:spore germination protein KA
MANINKIEKEIKTKYGNSSDLVFRKINIGLNKILYVYLESVSSDDKVSDFLVKRLSTLNKPLFKSLFSSLKNSIYNSHIKIINTNDDIYSLLSSGFTLIFVDGEDRAISIETRMALDRGVQESTSESIIRGPKDSFTENNAINLGLIRKRIKTNNLWFHEITLGSETKTKINVAFMKNIADTKKVDKLI